MTTIHIDNKPVNCDHNKRDMIPPCHPIRRTINTQFRKQIFDDDLPSVGYLVDALSLLEMLMKHNNFGRIMATKATATATHKWQYTSKSIQAENERRIFPHPKKMPSKSKWNKQIECVVSVGMWTRVNRMMSEKRSILIERWWVSGGVVAAE